MFCCALHLKSEFEFPVSTFTLNAPWSWTSPTPARLDSCEGCSIYCLLALLSRLVAMVIIAHDYYPRPHSLFEKESWLSDRKKPWPLIIGFTQGPDSAPLGWESCDSPTTLHVRPLVSLPFVRVHTSVTLMLSFSGFDGPITHLRLAWIERWWLPDQPTNMSLPCITEFPT